MIMIKNTKVHLNKKLKNKNLTNPRSKKKINISQKIHISNKINIQEQQ